MNSSRPTSFDVEYVNITPLNPLVSRCDIKVLYAGKNRNRSYITKEVANQMANSLPGTPIVGMYLYENADYGDHGEEDIVITENGIRFVKETVPYGFIDSNAKTWWQKFLDKDGVEREYLVTQGFLWTGRYPEALRIIESGNGQSMELHGQTLKGEWTKIDNEEGEYFKINEALFEGLCILGEDVEPCFEGASVTKDANLIYSLNKEDFKDRMSDFMTDLKEALVSFNLQGGENMDNTDVNLEHEVDTTVAEDFAKDDEKKKKEEESKDETTSKEEAAPEEEKEDSDEEKKKKFKKDDKEEDSKEDNSEKEEEDEEKKKKFKKDDKKEDEEEDDSDEDEDDSEDEEENKKKKKMFTEEEHNAVLEMRASEYSLIKAELDAAKAEISSLREFKAAVENKEKDAMIAKFFMLTDADKADVVENKANYSLDEIEAKLSVICVRNKVNFDLEDTSESETNIDNDVTTYNLGDTQDNTPSWLKAVDRVVEKRR